MMVRMTGLELRGGVWKYRKAIPSHLRPMFDGAFNIIRSLGTPNLSAAQRRYPSAKADVARLLAEAELALKNPATRAYRAVQEWKEQSAQRPPATKFEGTEEDSEDAADSHLIMLLEEDERGERSLDPSQRALFQALLKRRDYGENEDNPPLTILFERYYAERQLPPKTKLEWEGICRRFCEMIGSDLAARSITQAHIRQFKTALLTSPSKRTGKAMSPATVRKCLGALSAVLRWGKKEGYLALNPAEDITVSAKRDPEEGRQPYSADDLRTLFSRDACEARKERPPDTWLPWLALYTGARLEELGQLRVSDVREEEGVPYLAIEAGDGKKLKTRSSRRRIPLHPELIRLGFIAFVESQRNQGEQRLFPELRATPFSLTAGWSKYWGKHARDLGVADKRKTFHSFRHGWKDAARAVMSEEHHDAITGHSNGSVGRSYGRGVPLKVLAESMSRLTYPGLDVYGNR